MLVKAPDANRGAIDIRRNMNYEGNDMKALVDVATKHMYFQLIVKVILTLIELFLFFVVFRSISSDISKEIQKNYDVQKSERDRCLHDYKANYCDQEGLPFAMVGFCESWKICSETPPSEIGKTKAAVRVIAQLINELVNPLSPKAITVFVMIVIAWIMLSKGNF